MPGSKNTSEFDVSPVGASVFDSVSGKFFDFMMICLLESAGDTLIPQLYDVFGKENFLKFMSIFAGTTIKVPNLKIIEDTMRDVAIYLRLRDLPVGSRAEAVRDLAAQYSRTRGEIRRSFMSMESRFERYKMAGVA